MAKASGRILKGNNVKLEGRFHLEAEEAGPPSAKGKGVPSATPQVGIVENQPEFAVMEVTCSCGTKMYIRCEYAAAESPAEGPQTSVDAAPDDAQNVAPEDPNRESNQKGPQTSVDAAPDDAQNVAPEDPDRESDQTKIIGENENAN